MRCREERPFGDERISGSGGYVEEVLQEVGEAQKEMVASRLRQTDNHETPELMFAEMGLLVAGLHVDSRNR
jgi:putative transposase